MYKDVLGLRGMSSAEITEILDTALTMRQISQRTVKKVPTLRGQTVIMAFFENSTRTKTSFEVAAKRLSADVNEIGDGDVLVVADGRCGAV